MTVVVADLTATQFCDSAGIRTLLQARDSVAASHAQLRLAVARGGAVRRALQAIGLQRVLPLYSTVEAALAADRGRRPSRRFRAAGRRGRCRSASRGRLTRGGQRAA